MRREIEEDNGHYAPLLERRVNCDVLSVLFVRGFEANENGKGTRPITEAATDMDGNLIELLAIDDLRELQEQICTPGRYRVVAKDPVTKHIICSKDILMRPHRSRRRPPLAWEEERQREKAKQKEAEAAEPRVVQGDGRVVALLERQVASLERANSTHQDTIKALQDALREKSVEAASASTRVAGYESRVAELEEIRDELRDSLRAAQTELERVQQKLQDSDYSPLDALGALDQAIGSIRNTVRMFSDKDD